MTATTSPVTIRGYAPGDLEALRDICVRTGLVGGDATGHYADPAILPAIFAEPYAAFDPGLVFVADDGTRAIGYVVATDDSVAFFERFAAEWAPALAERFPAPEGEPATPDDELRDLLHHAGRMLVPGIAAGYPAHLHIDLLPEGQRRGLGRRLMDALFDALRARGVPGVHLGMSPANTNARAFYDRIGFTELPGHGANITHLGVRF
ncbi:GNAT family N-acetyltransferase [Streptomyces radicis]|uniref:GNAT family N-acetyltransferase n=1 Tax=Streptomyces radicis TaxID=1750517 RepID=A0A3A9WEC3_9ACTN|nr:GNAT family N-acetyltransferase [Streptomyces radicis]RKN11119.1 GNAT family N-acetyltransferase [Streptomyces radicis]RKN25439.1 GNAT family N-acetyltransferase [Streptomyces radicis]